MSENEGRRPRRRGAVLTGALCAVALAVGLPATGALAGGSGDEAGAPAAQSQGGAQERERDCPNKDRGGDGAAQQSSNEV